MTLYIERDVRLFQASRTNPLCFPSSTPNSHLIKFSGDNPFTVILKMALSQAATLAEKIIGHGNNATTEQDVTNPGRDRAKYADPSGEKMKALVWMGKNKVEVRMYSS
jgi:hypothetical protein